MTNAPTRAPACNQCRYWAPNAREETADEGVCRKLVENPRYFGSLVTEARDRCDQWARLGGFEDRSGQPREERRVALRNRINLPARIRTVGSSAAVWLADISELGVGIGMPDAPVVGTPVVISWSCYEVFGTVAWSSSEGCGLMFDTPISREVVLETMRDGALKNDRSAQTARIVPGRKRESLIRRPTYSG